MPITGSVKESNLLGRYHVLVTDKINNAIKDYSQSKLIGKPIIKM